MSWLDRLKELETSRDWPISVEQRLNQQISVSGFRSVRFSTIDAICSEGGQTFTVFLTPGKDELALKLNFSSIDITAPDNSPVKVSVEKLHKVGLLPHIFQQDVQEAFGITTSNLNHSGSTYLLECTPEWFTYEQMCVLGRHPLVIDVEITSRALYIQFVQSKTDSASSLRTCRRSGDSKSIASSV